MVQNRPFSYYTGPTATGTTKVNDITVGKPTLGFESIEVDWWAGPDEALGYVVCLVDTINKRTSPIGILSDIGFKRSDDLTEESFIRLSNSISGQSFISGNSAALWLTENGYWTSWTSSDSIRNSLGSTARGLYDSASDGDFISVNSTDYFNIVSGMSGTIRGTTENEFSGPFGSSWGAPFGMVNPTQTPLSSNEYIIAFSHIPQSNGIHGIFSSSTGVTGTYNRIGNIVSGGNNSTRLFWVRKSPPTPLGATSHISIYSNVTFRTKGESINPTFYKTGLSGSPTSFGPPFSTWTSNNQFPAFQYITTSNRQW
jgi:hypothetical protein